MSDFRQDFLRFALQQNVLKFGEFTTKAGRQSPYFFNAGLFNDGASTLQLAKFYAQAIIESKVEFDMLFGPAYKGIILAAATAMMLAEQGVNVPFAYNRKEAKDHGEGGMLVGADLKGKSVWVVDDVMTAGTAMREVVSLLAKEGASVAGIIVALDRKEKGQGDKSAIQELADSLNVPVLALVTMDDITDYVAKHGSADQLANMQAYRERYGIA